MNPITGRKLVDWATVSDKSPVGNGPIIGRRKFQPDANQDNPTFNSLVQISNIPGSKVLIDDQSSISIATVIELANGSKIGGLLRSSPEGEDLTLANNEDSIAIQVLPDGTVVLGNFDGVGQSFFGSRASLAAANTLSMTKSDDLNIIFDEINASLIGIDNSANSIDHIKDPWMKRSFQNDIEEGLNVSETTAIIATISPEGILKVKSMADGFVHIYRPDIDKSFSKNCYSGEKNDFPRLDSRNQKLGTDQITNTIPNAKLKKGDVVILSSDGLNPKDLEALAKFIANEEWQKAQEYLNDPANGKKDDRSIAFVIY